MAEDKVINMDELKLNTCEKSQIAKTEKGLELEVDLIIPCIGNTLNTQFLQPVLGLNFHLKVNVILYYSLYFENNNVLIIFFNP